MGSRQEVRKAEASMSSAALFSLCLSPTVCPSLSVYPSSDPLPSFSFLIQFRGGSVRYLSVMNPCLTLTVSIHKLQPLSLLLCVVFPPSLPSSHPHQPAARRANAAFTGVKKETERGGEKKTKIKAVFYFATFAYI